MKQKNQSFNQRLCRVPVEASYKIGNDGRPEMIAAEYADIPAAAIAEFLIARFGLDVEEVSENA